MYISEKQEPEVVNASMGLVNFLIHSGSTAVFNCKVVGEPAPKVTWSKGRKILTSTKDGKAKVYYDEPVDQYTLMMAGRNTVHSAPYITRLFLLH